MLRPIAFAARIDKAGPDDFVVTFADIPEALTGGGTQEAALAEASDALAAAVEGYLQEGRPLPLRRLPSRGEVAVPLPPALAARLLLAERMAADRLSKSALAHKVGRDEKVVRRILSGSSVSLDLVLEILEQLDIRPTLSV
jgi:antitoxin HicB